MLGVMMLIFGALLLLNGYWALQREKEREREWATRNRRVVGKK